MYVRVCVYVHMNARTNTQTHTHARARAHTHTLGVSRSLADRSTESFFGVGEEAHRAVDDVVFSLPLLAMLVLSSPLSTLHASISLAATAAYKHSYAFFHSGF